MNPNVFRIELPCPHCGEVDLQVIGELVGKDSITCRVCRGVVDLTDKQWQAGLRELIQGLRSIYIIPQGGER